MIKIELLSETNFSLNSLDSYNRKQDVNKVYRRIGGEYAAFVQWIGICEYLQKGFVLAACGEVSTDVLHPENGIAGTPDDVTDGKYIWPGDLAYYVMKYDLQLSKEFVEHMISQKWSVPDNIEIDFDNLEVI